jgi:hypothetical protein
MNINDMTRKQFEAVPFREDWSAEVRCDEIVILPQRKMHDSGYRCMDFVAVKNGEPVCRLSGDSDVIHVDGIGGFGRDWLTHYGHCPDSVPPSAWSIDCLPKSGLLRMWSTRGDMICGPGMSSFEIYATHEHPKENDASPVAGIGEAV